MTSFDRVSLDVAGQVQPYFVYSRVSLAVPRAYVLFSVPYGFNYLLRRVVSRWPERGAATIDPSLSVELFNGASSRPRQVAPVPFGLFSSPAGDDVATVASPAPGGVSMTAAPLQSLRIVNIAFPYGDTVRLEVTGQVAGAPAWLDLVLMGYLIPESALALWKGAARG